MAIEIPKSVIGRFTDVTQARAYVNAQAAKRQILTAGQNIAAFDGTPSDLNVDKGSVVATNVHAGGSSYPGDAMAEFTPIETPPEQPQAPSYRRTWYGARKAVPPTPQSTPLIPVENLKSIYFETRQSRYPETFAMAPTETGNRFEYVRHQQRMIFTEDKCGNLVIEEMTGY